MMHVVNTNLLVVTETASPATLAICLGISSEIDWQVLRCEKTAEHIIHVVEGLR